MIGVPAVVVGDHRQGAVGDFGFAGQAGFGVVGHADHIAAPAAVQLRFGLGGEGRALHAEVGATAVQAATLRQHGLHRIAQEAREGGAKRFGKSNVGHSSFAKKAGRAPLGSIDELIGDHQVQGPVLLLQ